MIHDLLEEIGENPTRPGLVDTPKRVVKSWKELYSGYATDIPSLFTVFEEDGIDEMVVLRDIEFYSTCEHHMLPFFGRAHIGYLPNKRVVVISKLARVLDAFSKRLQVQERLGKQVAETIMEYLKPRGCAVVLEARHMCMIARGVCKQDSIMTTSAMLGVFRKDAACRDEFLKIALRK